ncbi:PREDICTED: cytoplasmic polyadenylation element-binding protein 4 [Dipodomys ordii]|uniref:Cytoplasmic polyadenylation element-binding protein 4 n=1 Tax=Dipodomys ordii TaxID=10020 RepID=A0A1S3F5B5_DIPOR|nr:PREDICTED: cytoplasmic polyadenylation element-binding protein 4 [Dipodomys ordii]
MHSLETSLIDIMRAESDSIKGRVNYSYPGSDSSLLINGQSSLFPMEDGFLDDGRGDQPLPSGLGSPHCFPHQNGERVERYSRKVFVGGLPPDIDEDEITASFRRFGPLIVDWPHKAESKSYFPPKGPPVPECTAPGMVEVKPYVLDDQLCDECQGARCGGKFAPFFCANVTCLQYYCEYCWAAIHSRAGREFHKPLVKEGGDRPRHISFRWN